MNLYLDASAVVKRYVEEFGTRQVLSAIQQSGLAMTSVVSRAEVGAAMAKAVRIGIIAPDDGQRCVEAFRQEWSSYVRLPLPEATVARADSLAWEHGLRGYDAVHLASALGAQDMMAVQVTMATYDRDLWRAAGHAGLAVFPEDLPAAIRSAD